MVAFASQGNFEPTAATPRRAGLLIGSVYRLKVTEIDGYPGVEVFPTIEIIDRIYPPPGLEAKFPIPIQLTQDDLVRASEGQMVTRVIYLEDPESALPAAEVDGEQYWFDVGPDQDPLLVADTLGRPVAILRMGGLLPGRFGPDQQFLFGSPPYKPLATIEVIPSPVPSEPLPAVPHELPEP
ncbi:MAG: hypothetical protein DWQ31_07625 [Planctomycetota bacterium]|nr:MAG: hypothetical protein DWQ31_07625 [Planctomycetota bacterium]REJ89579.1 MAG: hypothetical protein DWQ35_17990 [Planctomycetota bacterium]REK31442.1 MAG: hypothetical protein DWQ42_00500 [Planctomycetota bacterium]REK40672.1 MAG: hypothetical protein DWQ46_15640 [Planctomycetota bacterium]